MIRHILVFYSKHRYFATWQETHSCSQRENWNDKTVALVHDQGERDPDNVTGAEASQAHGCKFTSPYTTESNMIPSYKERVFDIWQLHKRECPTKKPRQCANHSLPTSCRDFEAAGSWPQTGWIMQPRWDVTCKTLNWANPLQRDKGEVLHSF